MKTILRVVVVSLLLVAGSFTPVLAGGPAPVPTCPVPPCKIGK